MEVSDLNDILNVRAIKMETGENGYDEVTDGVEMSDPLSIIPQYVTESDLGKFRACKLFSSNFDFERKAGKLSSKLPMFPCLKTYLTSLRTN